MDYWLGGVGCWLVGQVGRAVARKALERLCNHNVVVMQNVKLDLLERIR